MKQTLSFLEKHLLLLLFLFFFPASTFASLNHTAPIIPTCLTQDRYPCNIFIVGDFESKCILPFENNTYYDEEPNTLIACQGMWVRYKAYADMGEFIPEKWIWNVSGESSYVDHNDGSISVLWGEGTYGHLTVTIDSPRGLACTKTVNVRLTEKPRVAIVSTPPYTIESEPTKIIYVCKGESVEFSDVSSSSNSDIVGYYWCSDIGGTSSAPNYTIENVWTDDKVTHRVYNNCGCFDEEIYEIRVQSGEPLNLNCYGTVCEGDIVTYTAKSTSCNQFSWYVDGGSIISGQNSHNITVQWDNPQNGYGFIALDGVLCGNNTCPSMLTKKIPIIGNNLTINGPTSACIDNAVIYSLPLFGSTEYNWNIFPSVGVTQVPVNGANEQMYIFNQAGTYQISVSYKCDFLECGEFTSAPLTVTVKPKLTITGEDRICISNTSNLSTSPLASVDWTIYDMDNHNQAFPSIPSQSSLALSFPHPGKYLIVAHDTSFCDDAEFVLTVHKEPPTPTIYDFDMNNPHTACTHSGILLKSANLNPNYTIIWSPVCNSGSPTEISGNEVTINYADTVCDVAAYTFDRILNCRSADAYIHTVKERIPLPLNLPSYLTVCPGTEINWGNNQIPLQENFLYKWKIQENMQYCASVQGNALSNKITLVINNFESPSYPFTFYVTLERRYCNRVIFDTIHFIVDTLANNEVSILADKDTACKRAPILFTGIGGDSSYYRWQSNADVNYSHRPSYTTSFASEGDHTVTLFYNPFDYCTHEQYFSSTNKRIHILPYPYASQIYLDSSNNTVAINVPTPNNYSYKWYYNDTIIPNANCISAPFLGPKCYRCTIVDTLTTCQNSFTKCFSSSPHTPCDSVGWDFINFDTCSSTLHIKTQIVNSPIHWGITNDNECSISYPNSSHTEATITFRKADSYLIGAHSTNDSCKESNYLFNLPFVPSFHFEKNCHEIIIHNNSSYIDSTTPIVMNINGETDISFLANNKTFHYPIPSNGSYSFKLKQPFSCDLDTVVFDDINEELILTVSNGSENPIRTCNNTPLDLVANLSSGRPIEYVLWYFDDGSFYKSHSNSICHTYAYRNRVYSLSAEVTDQNGCPITNSISVNPSNNNIEIGYLNASKKLVCPYVSSKKLSFLSHNLSHIPDQCTFQWNIGGNQNSNSLQTFFTSNYTVVVTDNNFCKEHAELDVIFKTRPTAIIISDKYKYCLGETIKLYGASGPDSNNHSFAWDIIDPLGNHSSPSTATVTLPANHPGTYEIKLNITNNQGCSADADSVHITVYQTPIAPIINYGSRRCLNDPPAELVGIPPFETEPHWSNGNLGFTAYYFNPGIASSWYYDPISGCKSDEAQITIDAQPNFDALLTGCYSKCFSFFNTPQHLPVWGLTQYQQEIDWTWFHDGSFLDGSTGNYTLSPLQLKLPSFGDYFLNVYFNNNNCSSVSPVFSIKEDADCHCEDFKIATENTTFVKDCYIYYDINVEIFNSSLSEKCLTNIQPLIQSQNLNVISTNFSSITLNSGDSYSFNILLEVSQFSPSKIATFQLFDNCNKCFSKFSINLLPDNLNCEEEAHLEWLNIRSDLSSSAAVYFDFLIDVQPCQTVFDCWTEPPMILNYWFDGQSFIQGLGMIDFATLTQLMTIKGEICLFVITCDSNQLCKRKFCIPADQIYNSLFDLGISPGKPIINNQKDKKQFTLPNHDISPSIILSPNPTTGDVSVVSLITNNNNNIGTTSEITEILILDLMGRQLASFENSSSFNIFSLPTGSYIVRIKTLYNNIESIHYHKIIKK